MSQRNITRRCRGRAKKSFARVGRWIRRCRREEVQPRQQDHRPWRASARFAFKVDVSHGKFVGVANDVTDAAIFFDGPWCREAASGHGTLSLRNGSFRVFKHTHHFNF